MKDRIKQCIKENRMKLQLIFSNFDIVQIEKMKTNDIKILHVNIDDKKYTKLSTRLHKPISKNLMP